jgi:NADH-quinone oxidoreductase subunit J
MPSKLLLFTFCVGAAVGLYLLVRPGRREPRVVGALIGIGAASWLMVNLPLTLAPDHRPEIIFLLFSVIAVAAAARMITHSKPVYSALYFILVVLSSAALFLLLHAEFMAFALVIVYAGAILITYLFVLMLAQQAPDPRDPTAQPEYDRVPREPLFAVGVGLLMLLLISFMVPNLDDAASPPGPQEVRMQVWSKLEQMPKRFAQELAALETTLAAPIDGVPIVDDAGHAIQVDDQGVAYIRATLEGSTEVQRIDLPESAMPQNVERVGLALVAKFPVSLELAGIILLLAMFGAVVLARKQIELGEEEVREAAGLPRYVPDDDLDEGGDA